MSIDIQLPKITATDTRGQVAQIQSYLFQLAEKLNWALSLTSEQMGNVSQIVTALNNGQASGQLTEQDAIETFNAIKALIIKSADIVEAYEQKLTLTFGSQTVALSDFGDYADYAQNYVDLTAQGITQELSDTEAIVTANQTFVRNTSAYIRTGNIGPGEGGGVDEYGVEVFQRTEQGGVIVEHKMARLTAGGLYFYFPSQSATDSVASFTASGIDLPGGHIIGGSITGSVITGTTIQGDTITGGTISGASISGGSLDAQNMTVTNLSANQITVGSGTPTSGSVAAALADLQNQIDGSIDTWYGTGTPTLSNYPVSSWAVADYDSHIGDIYYDNTDGTCYRFKKENNTYSWTVVSDTLVTEALRQAREAYDLADGKRTIYYGEPAATVTLEEGDMKVITVSGETRTYVYNGTSWVNAADYDTTIAAAVSSGISSFSTSLATSGTTTIHGGNIATGTITANQIAAGAVTTDKLSAGSVTANKIATGAVTADMITAGVLQDATGNVFYLDLTNGTLRGKFNSLSIGSDLVATQDYADDAADDAVSDYDTALNQSAVVNKLTGGSQNEGIYISNGHLYLNASAMKTGTLDARNVTVSNLSANSITGGTINGSNVTVSNLSASNITSGTLSVDRIAAKTIVADKIADGTITNVKVADGTLTASKFAVGELIADNIRANSTISNAFTCQNLTMTGGKLDISSASASFDVIKLSYGNNIARYTPSLINLESNEGIMQIQPAAIYGNSDRIMLWYNSSLSTLNLKSAGNDRANLWAEPMYGGQLDLSSSGSTYYNRIGMNTGLGYGPQLIMVAASSSVESVDRVKLSPDGLEFKNTSGTVTRHLDATASDQHPRLAYDYTGTWNSFAVTNPAMYTAYELVCLDGTQSRVLASTFIPVVCGYQTASSSPTTSQIEQYQCFAEMPSNSNYKAFCSFWKVGSEYRIYIRKQGSDAFAAVYGLR